MDYHIRFINNIQPHLRPSSSHINSNSTYISRNRANSTSILMSSRRLSTRSRGRSPNDDIDSKYMNEPINI